MSYDNKEENEIIVLSLNQLPTKIKYSYDYDDHEEFFKSYEFEDRIKETNKKSYQEIQKEIKEEIKKEK